MGATTAAAALAITGAVSAQERPAVPYVIIPPAASAQQPAAEPAPPPPPPGPYVLTMPSWARQPMPEYPDRAIMRGIRKGHATLRCGFDPTGALTDCQVIDESPIGVGFGAASLTGARRARLSPRSIQSAPEAAFVQFTVRYVAPEPELLAVVVNPNWSRPPRPSFPRRARNARITEASVVLDCELDAARRGRVRNCVVRQEDPVGYDFGPAAIRAARDAVIFETDLQNVAPDAHAVFTVHFERR